MAIKFSEQNVKSKLNNKKLLKDFLAKLFQTETLKNLKLQFVFVTDEALLEMNKKYLNHNTYTDIITFPLEETDKEVEAEIYISIDRVTENAIKFKTDYYTELHRVIFHGVLHLCGLKDKTEKQKQLMRQQEEYWLKKYFVE
jgi:probable rRNA maturation factor